MRYFKTQLAFILPILLFAASCKKPKVIEPTPTPPTGGGGTGGGTAVIAPPPSLGFNVVGYFPSYRIVANVPDVKFRMCNVVNYAFARLNALGGLTVEKPDTLIKLRDKAKAQSAKVFISISGLDADFTTTASTPIGRTSLVTQCMNIVRQYNLDGVDMDWEFPKTSNGTDITYTALMKQLSDSCHTNSKYYLTAAITAGKYAGSIRDGISTELLLGSYVDWFNIMSYDDFNTDPLYPYIHHTPLALSTTSFNYWITTRGMPASKAVLGIAGYGRPSGITQTNNVLSFDQILMQGGNPQSDSAIVSSTATTNYKIYYNGIATVKKKAMLAKQRGNGIMMWEKTQDVHDNNSLIKAVCDTLGRSY